MLILSYHKYCHISVINKKIFKEKANEETLLKTLKDNQNTEYDKKYGFDKIHSFEEYKARVPLTTYDDYAPYIKRMIKGKENNLITAYKVWKHTGAPEMKRFATFHI